jgi:hypothetical protein
MRKPLAVIAVVFAIAGCNGRIPNRVTLDEYGVYSQWMKVHFSKNEPKNLYISSRTFVFDPVARTAGCRANAVHDKAGVPWSFIKQLHALGEAEYRLPDAYSPTKLDIPWSYKLVDDWRSISQEAGQYRLVSFSRVAFDITRRKAFFAVSDACGGLCGAGAAVYAEKRNGAWVFKGTSCSWVY